MSEHGCLYYIDKQLFLKILNKAPSNKANLYNPSNVRARIDFPDMTVYFVDHLGTVRSGSDFYVIDRSKFASLLRLKERSRCR